MGSPPPWPPTDSMNTRKDSLIKSDSIHKAGNDLSQRITVIRLNYIITVAQWPGPPPLLWQHPHACSDNIVKNGTMFSLPLLFFLSLISPYVFSLTTYLFFNIPFFIFLFFSSPHSLFLLVSLSFLFIFLFNLCISYVKTRQTSAPVFCTNLLSKGLFLSLVPF